ncbi:MAG: hypothetical protein J5858_10460 [Lentisphaeria bacterium]|nr:hypothetical protein [Lentisphaeria bacterium]
MISTGFKVLDNVIGGLKKGKLYALSTDLDLGALEHFALNVIANTQRAAFFHSAIMSSDRTISQALTGWRFFHIGERIDNRYSIPDFPCRKIFFDRKSKDCAEDICEKFESHHRNTPFELSVFDINGMRAKDRKKFPSRRDETFHIIGLFQSLAKKYHIPVILIEFCWDFELIMPDRKRIPDNHPQSLVDSAENILILSWFSWQGKEISKLADYSLKLTVRDHFFGEKTFPVYLYTTDDVFSVHERHTHEKLRLLKREIKNKMALAMAEIRKIQDPVTLFREMKFGKLGFLPLGSCPGNITEQIDQSFSLLMCCYAAEKYFPDAAGFDISFVYPRGRCMFVFDHDGIIAAKAEVFVSEAADNDRKLRKILDRLQDNLSWHQMICYSAWNECNMKPAPGDEKVEVKFCPLDDFMNWIRE